MVLSLEENLCFHTTQKMTCQTWVHETTVLGVLVNSNKFLKAGIHYRTEQIRHHLASYTCRLCKCTERTGHRTLNDTGSYTTILSNRSEHNKLTQKGASLLGDA